jgi:polyisoprenoid-binding protein YceI
MKRLARLVACAVLGVGLLASVASAQSRTYTIDKAHSEVGFKIKHFFNKTYGQFSDFAGTIQFDPKNVAASTVEVTIQDSSINTENARRDNHLRSEDFFWVEKHPTITFKSTKVIPGKTPNNFQVLGDLTIRGVSKPVTLDVEYNGSGPVAIQGHSLGTQAGFNATTRVDRKDFGIVWNRQLDQGGVMLGDDVDISLSVAAISADEAKPTAEKSASNK